jgi:hypothetical protein
MADTELILRNDSGSIQVWGGQEIGVAGTYTVQDEDRTRLLDDDNFRVDLAALDAVVNNGIFDLTPTVALKALRQDRRVEEFTVKKFGVVSVGTFFQLETAPPGLRQFVVAYGGYFSSVLVTALSTTTFTVGILVNDVEVDTVIFPSSGSPQSSYFESLSIVVYQDDIISVKLNSGVDVEEPAIQLTLQDF